jgi:hypothetical protein
MIDQLKKPKTTTPALRKATLIEKKERGTRNGQIEDEKDVGWMKSS